MGRAKQQMMEHQSLGISSVPNKYVCVRHLFDNSINNFIRRNYKDGLCSYCNKEVKVIALVDLMEFIMIRVTDYYCDAAEFMSYNSREGGYLGETFDSSELIQEYVELDANPFELIEDIVDSLDNIPWGDPDKYIESESEMVIYRWEYFKNIVIHKMRFLFHGKFSSGLKKGPYDYSVHEILLELGKIVTQLKLIKTIPAGEIFYRCRPLNSKEKVDGIGGIVSTPDKFSIYPNRFSPSGISMFYGGFQRRTSFLETIDKKDEKKTHYAMGKLELKQDINIIDFSKLPEIPSIFSNISMKRRNLLMSIHSLVGDFTKPVTKDGKEHTEYIPTQVITEYFRFPFNLKRKNKIAGLLYPSSKHKGNNAIVLFWDNKSCINNLNLLELNIKKLKR